MIEIAGLASAMASSMLPSIILDSHVSVREPVMDVDGLAPEIFISNVNKQPTATFGAVPNQAPSADYERK